MRTTNIYASLFALVFLVFASCGSASKTGEDLLSDAREERRTIQQNHPEVADLFENSAGYAIFPNVGKGAYVIGGASGNGAVYENGNHIGYADLKQVDVGLQLGGKAFVEVLFFENQAALEDFKDGSYELSASASAVALEEGISRDINFQDGVAVVTMPKAGAMAGISVGGQRFTYQPAQ